MKKVRSGSSFSFLLVFLVVLLDGSSVGAAWRRRNGNNFGVVQAQHVGGGGATASSAVSSSLAASADVELTAATCVNPASCQEDSSALLATRGGDSSAVEDEQQQRQEALNNASSEEVVTTTADNDYNNVVAASTEGVELLQQQDEEEEEEADEEDDDEDGFTFPLYQPNDGHETDPDGIPTRYLLMHKQDRRKAKAAVQTTLSWRDEHDVDTILSRPHPTHDRVKAVYPLYLAGRDVHGHPILVQRPGLIELDLADRNNITTQDLLDHTVYLVEYCWNLYEPNATGVMTSVLDLSGASWRLVQRGDIIPFIKTMVGTMSSHYPSRSYKSLIINAPRWFGALYRLLKPLLRESTKKKIAIYNGGKEQEEALREVLGEDSLPTELLETGGTTTAGEQRGIHISTRVEPGPNSAVEQEIREHVVRQLAKAGMEMLPVVI